MIAGGFHPEEDASRLRAAFPFYRSNNFCAHHQPPHFEGTMRRFQETEQICALAGEGLRRIWRLELKERD